MTVAVTAARPSNPDAPVARLVPVVLALLVSALYLWDLAGSGYANTYYSAAAQAASKSWSAMFFGAFDAAGFITVDKPPVSLWAMGLSVRMLGLSPFAVLLPEALAGIGSVLLLWAGVRRQFGAGAALIAGVAFALTPVAALMFRYNNPDALLVLLLVGAAYALVRALDTDRFRWLVLAGVLVGFAFLTKYLQAYLVLPGFALVWLIAARGGLRRRIAGLVVAGVAVVAASAWWIVVVELLPVSSRPYIGGSSNNSALDLVLGYDGLGRIFGGRGPGGPGGPGGFGGSPGLLRMFNAEWGGEISWLLPPAAIGLLAALAARVGAARTDPRLAGALLWGSWAAMHVLVFSLMSGIAHPYYAVALAPALAALVGIGVAELWRLRQRIPFAGIGIALMAAASAVWASQLLGRDPTFVPGVGYGAISLAVAAAVILVVPVAAGDLRGERIAQGAVAVSLVALLAGSACWTAATAAKPLAGGDPAAGPASASDGGPGGFGGFAGDAAGVDQALVDYLLTNRGGSDWLVAVSSANQAGPIQLASGVPVMAMGGFMGSDPAPTLDQLKSYLAAGRLRYVLVGGRGGGPGGPGGPGGFFGGDGQGNIASARTAWVEDTCTVVTAAGNGALYDCGGAR